MRPLRERWRPACTWSTRQRGGWRPGPAGGSGFDGDGFKTCVCGMFPTARTGCETGCRDGFKTCVCGLFPTARTGCETGCRDGFKTPEWQAEGMTAGLVFVEVDGELGVPG